MPHPIVIDTCAIQDSDFRSWLYAYRGRKMLPMVAFVEFSVYMLGRGKSHEQIEGLLRRFGVEVEPFQQHHARTAADTAIAARDFKKNWRDHMIAAHAHTAPLRLVTYNVDDFRFLWPRVLSPQQARECL